MDAIKMIELTKKYKDLTAVDRLNLTIESGELFSLLGVNGAGKTITIKMLSCLTKPTSGDAVLLGKSVATESTAVKEIISVSPQETAVAPNLTVKENLELMAGVHGFSRDKSKARVSALIEQFGLGEIANKKAGKLSGGWQRRLIAIQEINKEYQQQKTNQHNLMEGLARMPEQSPAEAVIKT